MSHHQWRQWKWWRTPDPVSLVFKLYSVMFQCVRLMTMGLLTHSRLCTIFVGYSLSLTCFPCETSLMTSPIDQNWESCLIGCKDFPRFSTGLPVENSANTKVFRMKQWLAALPPCSFLHVSNLGVQWFNEDVIVFLVNHFVLWSRDFTVNVFFYVAYFLLNLTVFRTVSSSLIWSRLHHVEICGDHSLQTLDCYVTFQAISVR